MRQRHVLIAAALAFSLVSMASADLCSWGVAHWETIYEYQDNLAEAESWADQCQDDVDDAIVAKNLAQQAISYEMGTHGCNDPQQCGFLADLVQSLQNCQSELEYCLYRLEQAELSINHLEGSIDSLMWDLYYHSDGCPICDLIEVG